MEVEKPIFIISTGRSGSTFFQRVFAEHPNISWLSILSHKFPHKPELNRLLMHLIDYPIIGNVLKKRYKPDEHFQFWENNCQGFSYPGRDLTEEDITNKIEKDVINSTQKLLTSKRNRLLVKTTGWSRIRFYNKIFPDAKFIHILRDPRAAVNSMRHIRFWYGLGYINRLAWGAFTESENEEWEKYNKSFVAFSSILWKRLINSIDSAKSNVPSSSFMEIKYEELCDKPIAIFKELTDFCELKWYKSFEECIKKQKFKSTNYKWKQDLTDKQQKTIEEITYNHLKIYGYLKQEVNLLLQS